MGNEIVARRRVVLASTAEAARAGIAAMDDGGNAVDAAVAMMMVQCVRLPASGGYGGCMVVRLAKEGRVVAVDCDSRAPLGYRRELYDDPAKAETGYLACGVPGVTAGLALALRRFGKLRWSQLVRHAIAVAEEGFTVDKWTAGVMVQYAERADPVSLKALFPDGVPKRGERFVQKDLARFLRGMGDDPESLYRGELARRIVRQVRENGGILSEEDFTRFKYASEVRPVSVTYRGREVWTPPPPSGGVTSLAILKTLEQFPVGTMEPWGAPYYDILAETIRHCWADRMRVAGDPDFVNVPVAELLSQKAAAARADQMRAGHKPKPTTVPMGHEHTANVIAVDEDRNVACLTATHGGAFGSRVTIAGLGLTLGHGMSRFDFDPDSPNKPAPGKRMLHNMSPIVWIDADGKGGGAVGMPGGTRIVTVTPQVLVDMVDFGARPAKAVSAPRVHNEGDEVLQVGNEVSEAVFEELKLMGHAVRRVENPGGPVNAVLIDRDGAITGGDQAAEGIAGE